MLRSRSLFAALLLMLALAVACNKPSDDTISTDIKAKMFSEPLLKTASVNVTSKDGIVTLAGVVPDDAARVAARNIASQAKGVKQVIDSTTMVPPAPLTAEATPAPAPAPTPQPEPVRAPARAKPTAIKKHTAPVEPASAQEQAPAASASSSDPAPAAPAQAPAAPATPPPPPPPQPVTVTISEGTVVTVRTIDPIDSSTSTTGQTFRASLDNAVVVDDRVVLPKGLNAKLKIVQASSAGKFKGTSELTVSLENITYQGKTYAFATSDVQEKGGSRGKRSAAVIGGGAVLGAIIGGIAGGGKGAAIGAAAGGGGGTAVQAMTKGQQVKIPSESRLDFTLHAPVAITYIPGKKSSSRPAQPDQSTPQTDQQQQQ
jgi:outer membrane biosynthesis protein TonB